MRRNDWPERLATCIKEAMRKPFQWGQHDCFLFASDVIAAMTDVDPGVDIRGTYSTSAEAKTVLARLGHDSLYRFMANIASIQGYPLIPFSLARRGDVCICHTGEGEWPETVGVCMDGKIYAPGKRHLMQLPPVSVLSTWRI